MTKIQSHCICLCEWKHWINKKKIHSKLWNAWKQKVWGVNTLNLHFHRNIYEESTRNRNFTDELINFRNFCLMTCVQCVLSVKTPPREVHTHTQFALAWQCHLFIFFHIFTYIHIEIFFNITCIIYSVSLRERERQNESEKNVCAKLCSRCVPYFMLEKIKRFTYILFCILNKDDRRRNKIRCDVYGKENKLLQF